MVEITGVGEQIITIQGRETKETLGPGLKIARLISPRDLPNARKVAEMVGIPFEDNQLHGFIIDINGKRSSLLQVMEDMDLIGQIEGVPHLSVGDSTRTRALDSNVARAYLTGDGYGIKGMGLIRYDRDFGQTGFGLSGYLNRVQSEDIGGGEFIDIARREYDINNNLWLLFLLNTGSSKCARVMKVLDYQSWYDRYGHDLAGLVIREDGRRGVQRKELTKAIHDTLPTLTDFFIFPMNFFERDGHNAFLRDGKVVFTDYEAVKFFNRDYVDFMDKLGNSWYFEELRKVYSRFLTLYGLNPIGNIDYGNLRNISDLVLGYINRSDHKNKDDIREGLASGGPKAVIRYAMAGILGSRANARKLGQDAIEEVIWNSVRDNVSKQEYTLEEIENILQGINLPYQAEENPSLDERCTLLRDDNGRLVFRVHLNTFGLPIDADITIPVTAADIYESWRNSHLKSIAALKFSQIEANEFERLPRNLFSSTLYASLAGAFSNIKTLELSAVESSMADADRLAGYDQVALNKGRIILHTQLRDRTPYHRATFILGTDFNVTVEDSRLTIEADKSSLDNFPIADLNKIAYAIHASVIYLQEAGSLNGQTINIHIGDSAN